MLGACETHKDLGQHRDNLVPLGGGHPVQPAVVGSSATMASRLADDLDAGLLVVVLGAKPLEVLGGTQQGDAAACKSARRRFQL
jgi:hypothetical protein